MNHLEALNILHQLLQPTAYVEIGCHEGASLSLALCPALAIGPDFEIREALEAPTRIYKETSDVFFANRNLTALVGKPFDLAFIDGMRKAKYALRDFFNIERHAHSHSVIVIDSIFLQEVPRTTRERDTMAWPGDVYKIIPLLRDVRPDLQIDVFDIDMHGLAVIKNLSSHSTAPIETFNAYENFLLSDASELSSLEDIKETLRVRPVGEFETFVAELAAKRPWRPNSPQDAAQEAYLDLLKRSLLNEIYLDDELRLLYLKDCLCSKEIFDYAVYHDIRNTRRDAYETLHASRQIGRFPERNIHLSGFSHTMIGRKRLENLHRSLEAVRINGVPGDFVECGVWRGGSCILMAAYAVTYDMRDRITYVADSFEGLPASTHKNDENLNLSKEHYPELAVSLETVRENFEVYGLPLHNVRFLKGWFKDALPTAPIERIALLRLDGDLYESTMDAMTALYPKVSPGGIVIVDDYHCIPACKQAIVDYFSAHDLPFPQIQQIDWTGVWWSKISSHTSSEMLTYDGKPLTA